MAARDLIGAPLERVAMDGRRNRKRRGERTCARMMRGRSRGSKAERPERDGDLTHGVSVVPNNHRVIVADGQQRHPSPRSHRPSHHRAEVEALAAFECVAEAAPTGLPGEAPPLPSPPARKHSRTIRLACPDTNGNETESWDS